MQRISILWQKGLAVREYCELRWLPKVRESLPKDLLPHSYFASYPAADRPESVDLVLVQSDDRAGILSLLELPRGYNIHHNTHTHSLNDLAWEFATSSQIFEPRRVCKREFLLMCRDLERRALHG